MRDKTNEEKLRILKERLATIQQKEGTKHIKEVEKDKPIAPVFEEDLVDERKPESDYTKKKGSAWKIIFFLILFSSLGGFGYYLFNNDFKIKPTIDNIKEDFDTISKEALSFFEEEEIDNDKKEKKRKKKKDRNQLEDIIYNKSEFEDQNFIIVLNTFDKQEPANKERDKLTEKGYNCGVYLLAAVSNSEQEVFQTYIGPFNKEGEANQYLNSTDLISKGGVIKLQ